MKIYRGHNIAKLNIGDTIQTPNQVIRPTYKNPPRARDDINEKNFLIILAIILITLYI